MRSLGGGSRQPPPLNPQLPLIADDESTRAQGSSGSDRRGGVGAGGEGVGEGGGGGGGGGGRSVAAGAGVKYESEDSK